MRQIAAELDVTAAALYHHFANKEKLVQAVTDRGFVMFEKRFKAIRATDPHSVIRRILGEYRKFALEEPALFELMFVARRESARRCPADFAAHRSAVFDVLWNAVDAAISRSKNAESDDGSLYLAHDLWALTHGQILLWRAGHFENEKAFKRVLGRSIDRFISTL